jgi:hypothetical protein
VTVFRERDGSAGSSLLGAVLVRAADDDLGRDHQIGSAATRDDTEHLQLASVVLGDVVHAIHSRSAGADGEAVAILDVGDVSASNNEGADTVIRRDIAGHCRHRVAGVGVDSGGGHSADGCEVVQVVRTEGLEASDVGNLRTLVSIQRGVAEVGAVAEILRHVLVIERVENQLASGTPYASPLESSTASAVAASSQVSAPTFLMILVERRAIVLYRSESIFAASD